MEEYYNKSYTQIREMLRENVKSQKTVVQMQQKIVGDIKTDSCWSAQLFQQVAPR